MWAIPRNATVVSVGLVLFASCRAPPPVEPPPSASPPEAPAAADVLRVKASDGSVTTTLVRDAEGFGLFDMTGRAFARLRVEGGAAVVFDPSGASLAEVSADGVVKSGRDVVLRLVREPHTLRFILPDGHMGLEWPKAGSILREGAPVQSPVIVEGAAAEQATSAAQLLALAEFPYEVRLALLGALVPL